ncbi:hypothetical protein Pmani_000590 [Petrolisthes manimaculis]|uniref:Metalloendopeptidase n=1 Tax=Petrolisthes manimaculis TaxID=1843537 RepID=A0AAE1QLD1_9EUCA|nr:hypothetical protein Pmani_000590 [Petrolisthes manimaculis]
MKPLTAVSVLVLLLATTTTSFKHEVENSEPPNPSTSIIQFIADFIDGRPNPEEVDGKLLHVDMILAKKQRRPLEERAFYENYDEDRLLFFWPPAPESNNPYPVVPYVFDSSVGTDCVDAIKDSIADFEANTCITFHETTNINQPHVIFIMADWFTAWIGRHYFWNGQEIYIGPSCDKAYIGQFIGVTLLYFFEEVRPDRDNYVHINMENLPDTGLEWLFTIKDNLATVEYDYTSLFRRHFRHHLPERRVHGCKLQLRLSSKLQWGQLREPDQGKLLRTTY